MSRIASIVLTAFLVVGCGVVESSQDGTTAPIAAPAPKPPPCVHETCGERPVRYRCESYSTYVCYTYRIEYEHHCTCDRWGDNVDGGAP